MQKRIRALLALTLALAALCGCSGSAGDWVLKLYPPKDQRIVDQQQSADEAPKQEIERTDVKTEVLSSVDSFGLAYQPDYGLHPYNCESLNNRVILSFLYEPLFAVTADYEAQPVLAEDYEVSDDGLTTTVHLRSGARFSDGTALRAEDVTASLEASRGSEYYGTRLRNVTSIAAADEKTVVFTTGLAYECLPLLLDVPIVKSGTLDFPYPVGTGPYRMRSTKELLRVKDWWQDTEPLVDFDTIVLTQVTTSADIRDNFEYEKVNMVLTDPNSSAFAGFHNDYELWLQPGTTMQYIGYNLTSDIFSNYGLRGAITYALDREKLVTELMGGFAAAAVLPCAPDSRYYDAKLAASFSYSPSRYYQQLESASVEDMDGDGVLDLYVPSLGYALPVEGSILVCSSNYARVQAADELVRQLNALGFRLTLESLDYTEYKRRLLNNDFDLYYGEVRLSPNFDLSAFFGATGTLNYGGLYDSTMMHLCAQALANSGNTYSLYKRLCERGYITPVLFKSCAVYTTRGALSEPATHVDWFLPQQTSEE